MPNKGKKHRAKRSQYLIDRAGLAGKPEDWEDRLDYGSDPGLHDTTLYDENESQSGALYDETTGKPYKNDTNMPSGLLHSHVDVSKLPEEGDADLLGDLYDPGDDVDTLLNKPADRLTPQDIEAMKAYYEKKH